MSMETNSGHWQEDILRRRESAALLQKLIEQRSISDTNQNAICMAIDGDWGTGKSFFIDNWARTLADDGRCVIFFDAWKNDLSDDPIIGFMSEINKCLKPWLEKIAINDDVPTKIKTRTKVLIKNAAKAIIPFAKQVAIHNAAKFISEEATATIASISGKDLSEENNVILGIKSEEVEKYFSAALKGHEMQNASITKLIGDLEALAEGLKYLNEKPPIYIFIDELDRCRPTYAIKLLESIKHIFNAKGICFILATNIEQLSHSIKAVYGESFNGRAYLKRFIDYEYKLNPPNYYAFCHNLYSKSFLSGRLNMISGISGAERNDGVSDVLADVANLFSLDLRSIKQILGQIELSVASIDESEEIHCLYMFALAAVMHKRPNSIDELCITSKQEIADIDSLTTGSNRIFTEKYYDELTHNEKELKTTIKDLILLYQRLSIGIENGEYQKITRPASIYRRRIAHQAANIREKNGSPKIQKYPRLLRMTGSLTSN